MNHFLIPPDEDPYFDTERCVERLYDIYVKHEKLIVAVDFDDTIYDFHDKGFKFPRVINLLKRCENLGFYIVVFTSSEENRYSFINEYCKKIINININAINKNVVDSSYGKTGKIFYNILLDDRAGLLQAVHILEKLLYKIEMKNFYKESERQ